MIAAEEHRRYGETPPFGGLRVARILEKSVGMALFREACRVADHPGNEATDRLDHRHRGDLTAIEHIVTDAHELHAGAARGVVDDALIDSLIAPASKNQLLLHGQLQRHGLRENLARW